jgi:hypothetical protein
MSDPIGNSGFEAVVGGFRTGKHGGTGTRVTIKNVKTGESIGSISGKRSCPPRGDCWGYTTDKKTFYGLDDRYYHVMVTWNKAQWGQVQSTGAVIDSKRSVITVLDFYPIYVQKSEPVLTPTPVPVEPVVPVTTVIPIVPKITSFKQAKKVYVPEKKPWLERLINWIKKTFNLK